MNGRLLAKIGTTAVKIYANHLLSFTAGAIAGGIYVALALIAANTFVVLR